MGSSRSGCPGIPEEAGWGRQAGSGAAGCRAGPGRADFQGMDSLFSAGSELRHRLQGGKTGR